MGPLVQSVDMEQLLAEAERALENAYAPYSEYAVGAAVRATDGSIYTGCNVENANYSNSVHAEELALAKAVEAGRREFEAIAVSSGRRDGVTPCGMCRQSLSEFDDGGLRVICDRGDDDDTYTLGELLPAAFGGGYLE